MNASVQTGEKGLKIWYNGVWFFAFMTASAKANSIHVAYPELDIHSTTAKI